MRIEQYLSQQGIASRRESQELIRSGAVLVNGKIITETGIQIDPIKDTVDLSDDAKKRLSTKKQTVLINKPRGVICAKDQGSGKTVFDVFSKYRHLNTVGRLDKESEGLLLLSNDGLVTKAVTGKERIIEKEYRVTVREDVLPFMIKKMEKGMKLRDGMTLPAKAKKLSKHEFLITLTEGRKHQIRRMANKLHLTVEKLERIRIHTLTKKSLKGRRSRELSQKEVEELKTKMSQE